MSISTSEMEELDGGRWSLVIELESVKKLPSNFINSRVRIQFQFSKCSSTLSRTEPVYAPSDVIRLRRFESTSKRRHTFLIVFKLDSISKDLFHPSLRVSSLSECRIY